MFTATFKIKPVCYKIKVSVTYIVYVYLAGSLSNWLMFSLTFSFFGLNWKAYPKKQIQISDIFVREKFTSSAACQNLGAQFDTDAN